MSNEPTPEQLVSQLIVAGDWPEPDLLRAIQAKGSGVIEPLRVFLQRENPINLDIYGTAPFVIRILGQLGAQEALPEMLVWLKKYTGDNEILISLEYALFDLGETIFEPLAAYVSDPQIDSGQTYAWEVLEWFACLSRPLAFRLRELARQLLNAYLADPATRSLNEDIAWDCISWLWSFGEEEDFELIAPASSLSGIIISDYYETLIYYKRRLSLPDIVSRQDLFPRLTEQDYSPENFRSHWETYYWLELYTRHRDVFMAKRGTK